MPEISFVQAGSKSCEFYFTKKMKHVGNKVPFFWGYCPGNIVNTSLVGQRTIFYWRKEQNGMGTNKREGRECKSVTRRQIQSSVLLSNVITETLASMPCGPTQNSVHWSGISQRALPQSVWLQVWGGAQDCFPNTLLGGVAHRDGDPTLRTSSKVFKSRDPLSRSTQVETTT